jgi:predicted dienelactone hydrolase
VRRHTAPAGESSLSIAGVAVTEWEGHAPAAGPQPVVIFSHGFHGCATQSRFLMQAFADAGYLVFAPNHRDAVCGGGAGSWFDRPEAPFLNPEKWTDLTYRDRAEDIRKLTQALRGDAAWRGRIDWGRLALAGHSLGGYTVLGLAGAWPSWRLPEVRAVLALSPYSQPFLRAGTLHGLAAPVMYQGGTLDFGTTPALDKAGGAFAASPAPNYFVELSGATHFAWTNLGRRDRDAIIAYSLAFLNHALNGAAAGILHPTGPGVADLRFAER